MNVLIHADITKLNKLNKTLKVYTYTYINLAVNFFCACMCDLILEICDFPHLNFSTTSLHEPPLPSPIIAFKLCSHVIYLLDAIFLTTW